MPFKPQSPDGDDKQKSASPPFGQKSPAPSIPQKTSASLPKKKKMEDLKAPGGSKTLTGEPKNQIETQPEIDAVAEHLSLAGRLKRRQSMRRNASKIEIAKDRAMRRRANMASLRRRARKKAIELTKTRLAGGRDVNQLSAPEKSRLEDIVAKRKKAIERLSQKLIRDVRDTERKRLSAKEEYTVEEVLDLSSLILDDISEGFDQDRLLKKSKEHDIPFTELFAVYSEHIDEGVEECSAKVNTYIIEKLRARDVGTAVGGAVGATVAGLAGHAVGGNAALSGMMGGTVGMMAGQKVADKASNFLDRLKARKKVRNAA